MLDLGYVLPGTTINIPFATYDSNDPSASVTTTGLAVGDIEIYRDGGLTQRAGSDAGFAVDIDFDALTGLHTIQIDLSDNTDAGFFRAGSEYLVAVSSITVDAATVSLWAARFTIGVAGMLHGSTIAAYTSTDNFTLNTGSTNDDAYNGCILIAYDVATQYQMQVGVIEDYTGSTKTVNLKADPGVFTMTANDNIIIMPPALLPTTAGTTLDVTTAGNAGIDWGNVANPTTAVDLSATDIQLADTTTAVTNGVTLANGAVTNASLAGNMEIVFETDFATNYNQTDNAWVTNGTTFIGTGWNTGKTGYSLTATTGLGNQTANITGNLSGSVGSVTGSVGSISGVTFPTNFADMSITVTTGLVDITQAAADKAWGTATRVLTAGTNLNDIAAGDVWAVDATTQQTQGTFGQAIGDPVADTTTIYQSVATDAAGDNVSVDVAAVKAETALIVADTNELQTDDVPTLIAAVQADTDDIQTRLPAALVSGRMSSDAVAISGSTAAADNLEASALTIVPAVCEGTPSTTVIQTDLAETTDDHYIGRIAIFIDGAGAYQATDITDYTGSTGTITVTALTTAPSSGDSLVIV